jgi:C-terminal processing protease CtpA/Prc
MYIYNPDGTRFHGVGIIPDIIVPRTIDAVAEGKDEELDVALRHLQTELGLKAMPTEVK